MGRVAMGCQPVGCLAVGGLAVVGKSMGLTRSVWVTALACLAVIAAAAMVGSDEPHHVLLAALFAGAFIVVQQGLLGFYLGCSFAPNHKGMLILAATDQSDFLRRQVLTSRNVLGGRLTDLALGGLNYQIEHHLFPSPRSWLTSMPSAG